jgi:hypothetical protein
VYRDQPRSIAKAQRTACRALRFPGAQRRETHLRLPGALVQLAVIELARVTPPVRQELGRATRVPDAANQRGALLSRCSGHIPAYAFLPPLSWPPPAQDLGLARTFEEHRPVLLRDAVPRLHPYRLAGLRLLLACAAPLMALFLARDAPWQVGVLPGPQSR